MSNSPFPYFQTGFTVLQNHGFPGGHIFSGETRLLCAECETFFPLTGKTQRNRTPGIQLTENLCLDCGRIYEYIELERRLKLEKEAETKLFERTWEIFLAQEEDSLETAYQKALETLRENYKEQTIARLQKLEAEQQYLKLQRLIWRDKTLFS